MKELSLNILDLAQNSIKAGAKNIKITLLEYDDVLVIEIYDDGKGMSPKEKQRAEDPFFTTRTTRAVGLGIPFFKSAAEQTGGSFGAQSQERTGSSPGFTKITGCFNKYSIDFTPLGDIIATVCAIVGGLEEQNLLFTHKLFKIQSLEDHNQNKNEITPYGTAELDTSEMREVLGDIPLRSPEVILWVKDFLANQYATLYGGKNKNKY